MRPELAAWLWRGREVGAGLALALAGLWLMWLGGVVLIPLGGAVLGLGAVWAVQAARRARFAAAGDAPGIVEVDEGQVSYFGPQAGGAVALPDLVEVRLMTLQGRRLWRLKQADGQALLIPVEAVGAERLFDAFAALPAMDTAALVAALEAAPAQGGTALTLGQQTALVWQRPQRGLVRV